MRIDFYKKIYNRVYITIQQIILILVYIIILNCIPLYGSNISNVDVVPPIPSILSDTDGMNWKVVLSNMLENVFFIDLIPVNSNLLINIIINRTNGSLPTIYITSTLIELISKSTNKCHIMSMMQLYCAYRELEIPLEDVVNSYEFAMKIAHYLKADHIIYGIAYGDAQNPSLELQLISSKNGEILHVVDICT